MATLWNRPPKLTDQLGSTVDKKSALQSGSAYVITAATSAAAVRYGQPFLTWIGVPHASAIGVTLSLLAALCVLAAVNTFSRWRDSNARVKAQAALRPRQRELLGLPPTPPAKLTAATPDAAPAAARAATLLATPISPAQRLPPLAPSAGAADATPRHLVHSVGFTPGSAGRSSMGPSPGSKRSPWSGSVAVATPQQLKQYTSSFTGGDAGAGGADAGTAASPAASPLPVGQLYYDQSDPGLAGSPALPTGRDAPHYRPSLLARKAAAAAGAAAGEGLQPSADAEAGRIMRDILQMQVPELLVWTERFREWFATQLLAPLSLLMDTAHEEPNAHMARLVPGQQAPQLPPITQLLEVETDASGSGANSSSNAMSSAAGGAAGIAGGLGGSGLGLGSGFGPMLRVQGGGMGSGSSVSAVEDARNMAQNLMESLRHSQLPYGYDPQPLLMALHRYSELLWVLSGRRPSELLPPAPPSYIATRVRQLAQGSCAKAFNWNGGGEHAGRPWSPELPTDSALLLYLFAAFLDAPGWQFPLQSSGPESGRGAPLYLGSLRSRPPGNYSALLAFRPDKPGPGAIAVIGSNLASKEPRFSLLIAGQLVTLCDRDGLFKSLLMWLQFHLVERQGLVGGRYLNEAALGGLEAVLAPVNIAPTVPQRVFNWWFPVNKW
ncbi:hypothetical protein OEZ86_002293 [Tetradesmus obliquus]|nr:hypothetical protein OEZ86_002293 [Tetradesmus obliquus]